MYVVKFQGKVCSKILSIQDHTPALPKSYSGFTKITLRFYQNHWLIFTTSLADFHKITLWFFSKSHSDFSKIALRLYQNHTPTLPKSHSDFAKIALRLYQNPRLIFTKSLTDFRKNEGWFWSPRLLFYRTPFQNRTLPHCESCLSEGFSSFVTSLSGSPHCFCPCLFKKNLVLFSSCLAFHHFAVLR